MVFNREILSFHFLAPPPSGGKDIGILSVALATRLLSNSMRYLPWDGQGLETDVRSEKVIVVTYLLSTQSQLYKIPNCSWIKKQTCVSGGRFSCQEILSVTTDRLAPAETYTRISDLSNFEVQIAL